MAQWMIPARIVAYRDVIVEANTRREAIARFRAREWEESGDEERFEVYKAGAVTCLDAADRDIFIGTHFIEAPADRDVKWRKPQWKCLQCGRVIKRYWSGAKSHVAAHARRGVL